MTKPTPLTKAEKETILLYNQTLEPVIISGYDPKLLRTLERYAQRHPDLCRRVDKCRYPDYAEYEVRKDRVSVRLLEPLSEEQRQAAAERALRLNHRKNEEG